MSFESLRRSAVVLTPVLAVLAGCGGDDDPPSSDSVASSDDDDAGGDDDDAAGDDDDDDDDDDTDNLAGYEPCPDATHLGDMSIALEVGVGGEAFTRVGALFYDSIDPSEVPIELASEGACKLMTKEAIICDPPCDVGEVCLGSNVCGPKPAYVTFGAITVDGLAAPVELELGPANTYVFKGTLPFPPFAPGDPLQLHADGGEHGAFSLVGAGLSLLDANETPLPVDRDTPATITWTPDGSGSHMVARLNVNNHGHGWNYIDCVAPEADGTIEVPASLVTALMDKGLSGYPNLLYARRFVDSVDTELGCVGFVVEAGEERAIEIPGLVSCSGPGDCPEGQECLSDLTCG